MIAVIAAIAAIALWTLSVALLCRLVAAAK